MTNTYSVIKNKLKFFLKNHYDIILIVVMFLLIRIPNIFNYSWYESSAWVREVLSLVTFSDSTLKLIPHFPLTLSFFKTISYRASIIDINIVSGVKIAVLISSVIVFYLVYKFSFTIFKERKIAVITLLFLSIYFYAFQTGIQIDQDSTLNLLFLLLTIYTYYKNKDNLSLTNIIKIGLSAAFLTCSRLPLGIMAIGAIFIDILLNFFRELKKTKINLIIWRYIKKYLLITFFYVAFSSLILLLYYLIFPDLTLRVFWRIKENMLNSYNTDSILMSILFKGQLLLFTTPIILGCFYVLKDFKKYSVVFITLLLMCIYVIKAPNGDPGRRFMPAMPFLVILIGNALYKYIDKIKYWILSFLVAFVLFFRNSLINYENLPAGISDFVSHPIKKILILTTTTIEPIYLVSSIVYVVFFVCILLFIISLLKKKKIFIVSFFVISLGFNIFMVMNKVIPYSQPSFNNLTKKLSKFCYNNCHIGDTIYSDYISKDTANIGLIEKEVGNVFYWNKEKNIALDKISNINKGVKVLTNINGFSQRNYEADHFDKYIKENGSGYVFITNYFGEDYNRVILEWLNNNCDLRFKSYGNTYVSSVVYYCKVK